MLRQHCVKHISNACIVPKIFSESGDIPSDFTQNYSASKYTSSFWSVLISDNAPITMSRFKVLYNTFENLRKCSSIVQPKPESNRTWLDKV